MHYAIIENESLCYIRFNQSKLNVDLYHHYHIIHLNFRITFKDAFENSGNLENIRQQVILPSTFISSLRNMH